jgi:hypothetical protein
MIYKMNKLYTMEFRIHVSKAEYGGVDAWAMPAIYDIVVDTCNERRPYTHLALGDLSDIYAPVFVLYSPTSLSSRLLHEIEKDIKSILLHWPAQNELSDEEIESIFADHDTETADAEL